jgi:hypothetical protein
MAKKSTKPKLPFPCGQRGIPEEICHFSLHATGNLKKLVSFTSLRFEEDALPPATFVWWVGNCDSISRQLSIDAIRMHWFFGAGFLELCRIAQCIQLPKFFGWPMHATYCPSYHLSAAFFVSRHVRAAATILGLEDRDDERFADRTHLSPPWAYREWAEDLFNSHQGELEEWYGQLTLPPTEVFPYLGMEELQTMRVWSEIPTEVLIKINRPVDSFEIDQAAREWRGEFSKKIVGLLEKGIVDTDAIVSRTGADKANVRQVKRRHLKIKPRKT